MSEVQTTSGKEPRKAIGAVSAVESLALIQLCNRLFWLPIIISLVLLTQLTIAQSQTMRFDTLELMSILTACLEAGAVIALVILIASTPVTKAAWDKKHKGQPFSLSASAIASMLIVFLITALITVPLMFFHSYPELVAQGIRTPLMLMQRIILILGLALISANLMLVFRMYLKLPWLVAACLGGAFHVVVGFFITRLSFGNDTYARLNDVFYYNQLWRHFDWFPKLQRTDVFHNIEMPYFGYYVAACFALWLLTLSLWLPKAYEQMAKETRGK